MATYYLAYATSILLAVLTIAHEDIFWVPLDCEGDGFAETLATQCVRHGCIERADVTWHNLDSTFKKEFNFI